MLETPDTWTEAAGEIPRLVVDFAVDLEHTALLVVDMQNFDAKPHTGLGKLIHDEHPEVRDYLFPRIDRIVLPNNARLVEAFREAGRPVIFLAIGPLLPDGSDMFWRRRVRDAGRAHGSTHPDPDSLPAAIVSELEPREDELVLQKNSMGAFNSTAIDQILRNMEITGLVITGVATDACVETTARDAADRGYNCYLVEDACATFSVRRQQKTMESFASFFGKVKSTDDVLAEIAAPSRAVG